MEILKQNVILYAMIAINYCALYLCLLYICICMYYSLIHSKVKVSLQIIQGWSKWQTCR